MIHIAGDAGDRAAAGVLPYGPDAGSPNVVTAADGPGSAGLRILAVIIGDPGNPLRHAGIEPIGMASAYVDYRLNRYPGRESAIRHDVAPGVDPLRQRGWRVAGVGGLHVEHGHQI